MLARLRDAALLTSVATFTAGYALFGLVALVFTALAELIARTWRWVPSPLDRPLAALLVVVLASAVASPLRALAILPAVLMTLTAVVSVRSVAAYLRGGPPRLLLLLLLWCWGGVAGAIWWVARAWPDYVVNAWTGRPGQNAIGTTLAVATCLTLGLLPAEAFRGRRWLAASAPVILAGLVVTWTRAAWLGAAIGAALLVLLSTSARARIGLMVTVALVGLAGVLLLPRWPGLQAAVGSLSSFEANRNRLAIWRAVPRMVADHPLLGTGFGTFMFAYPPYRPPDAPDAAPPFAHNILLNFAAETGLLGLAAIVWLCAAGVVSIWRWRARTPPDGTARAAANAVLAATAALLVNQMFDGTLMSVHIGFGFLTLLTIGAVECISAPADGSGAKDAAWALTTELRPTRTSPGGGGP